jgi:demethylspheroidene O-methyltransferase
MTAAASREPGSAVPRVPSDRRFSWRGIEDCILASRDRLLASMAFQTWASGFPLTRWIARKRARALFDLCAGFVYSQVLFACCRLRVCEILMDRPRTPEQLADLLSLPLDPTIRLLEAAEALSIVARRRDGRFGVGALGAALVGNPGVAAMIEHHTMLYDDLRDPVGLLRGKNSQTRLGTYWAYAGRPRPAEAEAAEVADYTALMASTQALVAADVLAAYRLDRHRGLLDLGGGDGTFATLAAASAPALRLLLFDLPPVAARAAARFSEAGLDGRAQAIGGDFRRDTLPRGADIVSLIRVIHDHDDDTALAILRAAREALPPDGTLLLAEPMAGTRGAEPVGAYFNFYLLAMGSGRPRHAKELIRLVSKAGFARARLIPTRRPILVRVLVGQC